MTLQITFHRLNSIWIWICLIDFYEDLYEQNVLIKYYGQIYRDIYCQLWQQMIY